jgi:hypothetical protein
MDRNDRTARGKLALTNGYVNLVRANADPQAARQKFEEAASLITRSPDPHLGLARVYIYSLKNVGKAVAELHSAERLGFHLGPREMEQEADGYRIRAVAELSDARKYSGTVRSLEERYLRLAQRDFERARQLYEPILGFSNVNVALRQVDDEDRARQQLDDTLKKPAKPARRQRRSTWRASRWQ